MKRTTPLFSYLLAGMILPGTWSIADAQKDAAESEAKAKLSKALTLRSLPEIGRRFGGRDHTTVLHAVRKIEGLSASDATLREELELLKRMLQE